MQIYLSLLHLNGRDSGRRSSSSLGKLNREREREIPCDALNWIIDIDIMIIFLDSACMHTCRIIHLILKRLRQMMID